MRRRCVVAPRRILVEGGKKMRWIILQFGWPLKLTGGCNDPDAPYDFIPEVLSELAAATFYNAIIAAVLILVAIFAFIEVLVRQYNFSRQQLNILRICSILGIYMLPGFCQAAGFMLGAGDSHLNRALGLSFLCVICAPQLALLYLLYSNMVVQQLATYNPDGEQGLNGQSRWSPVGGSQHAARFFVRFRFLFNSLKVPWRPDSWEYACGVMYAPLNSLMKAARGLLLGVFVLCVPNCDNTDSRCGIAQLMLLQMLALMDFWYMFRISPHYSRMERWARMGESTADVIYVVCAFILGFTGIVTVGMIMIYVQLASIVLHSIAQIVKICRVLSQNEAVQRLLRSCCPAVFFRMHSKLLESRSAKSRPPPPPPPARQSAHVAVPADTERRIMNPLMLMGAQAAPVEKVDAVPRPPPKPGARVAHRRGGSRHSSARANQLRLSGKDSLFPAPMEEAHGACTDASSSETGQSADDERGRAGRRRSRALTTVAKVPGFNVGGQATPRGLHKYGSIGNMLMRVVKGGAAR
ncbi:hypothetical protein CYMTET_29760, partial [Cymbomonas tetramitiformis]